MITDERRQEVRNVRQAAVDWAHRDEEVVATVLVGSWARDEARMDSDVDIVVLSSTDTHERTQQWINDLGLDASVIRTADWGAITERRVESPSGLQIEFGFGRPSWVSIDPIDPGTRRVVTDGCEVWYDPGKIVDRLLTALSSAEG